MNCPSVLPLIEKWELYIQQHPQGDMHRFAMWLLEQSEPALAAKTVEGADPRLKSGRPITEEFAQEEEFLANFYLGRMTRYLKFYLKPILHEHGFASPDEFNLLAMIEQMDEPTKKELCTATVTELTTGQAIIRRLLERDLILERVDERDGRAKRLTVTEKGAALLQHIYSQLQGLQPKALADLPESDRKQLLRLLKYLNHYHFQTYANGLSES